jgi:hypothetical protein
MKEQFHIRLGAAAESNSSIASRLILSELSARWPQVFSSGSGVTSLEVRAVRAKNDAPGHLRATSPLGRSGGSRSDWLVCGQWRRENRCDRRCCQRVFLGDLENKALHLAREGSS